MSPAIVAQGLTRKFGDLTVVDKVSFEVQKGSRYATFYNERPQH